MSKKVEKKIGKNLASGFEPKKQADFGQTSRFFEFDAAHRTKKTARAGQNLTFFGRNGSG
jgi:hypothetical protein